MGLGLALYSTVVRVRNLAESERWLEEVLGCRHPYHDLHFRLTTFEINHPPRLTIWELPPGQELNPKTAGGAIPVFASENLEQDRNRLRQMGVATEEIVDFYAGRWFLFRDPDGNPYIMVHVVPDDGGFSA